MSDAKLNLNPHLALTLESLKSFREILIARLGTKLTDFHVEYLRKTEIQISATMRTTAGKANLTKNYILMNSVLLGRHPEQVESTFAHELAHIAAPLIYGRRGHGHKIGWKLTMKALGYAPDRTHDLDVSGLERKHRIVGYLICPCHKIPIKPVRAKKVLRGARYICRQCKTTMIFEKAGG